MSFNLKTALVTLLAASASAAPVEVETRGVSSKKGLAYNDGSLANGFKGTASWGYSWGTTANGLDPSIEFVPMIHNPTDPTPSMAGVNNVLGYNEPDMNQAGGGCATSPTDAAKAWAKLAPQLNGPAIGCPAVTSNKVTNGPVGPSGLVWLTQFVDAVGSGAATKCSFQPLHWYGNPAQDAKTQALALQTYLTSASAELDALYGKNMPIWLTEFAAEPTTDLNVQASFLAIMVPWLEKFSGVARYSPFMVATGQLTSTSASGSAFINN